MRTLRLVAALLLLGCAVLVSSTAFARTATFGDPAGDGVKGRRLDITDVKVTNRDHAVVTNASFVRVTYGDLGLALKARGDSRHELAGAGAITERAATPLSCEPPRASRSAADFE